MSCNELSPWYWCYCAVNLGALTLHALFENWPSAHTALVEEETRTVEKGGY